MRISKVFLLVVLFAVPSVAQDAQALKGIESVMVNCDITSNYPAPSSRSNLERINTKIAESMLKHAGIKVDYGSSYLLQFDQRIVLPGIGAEEFLVIVRISLKQIVIENRQVVTKDPIWKSEYTHSNVTSAIEVGKTFEAAVDGFITAYREANGVLPETDGTETTKKTTQRTI